VIGGARAPGAAWRIRAAACTGLVLLFACGRGSFHVPASPEGSVQPPPELVLGFHDRADAFYQQLILRRFNALETFKDPFLRQHFQTVDRFFDYYASLASELHDANFEKSRPTRAQVEEFVFDTPTTARVLIRFEGDDDRPLRPTSVSLVRVDRWERVEQSWWVSPGKL
jgi:hypothetical protein